MRHEAARIRVSDAQKISRKCFVCGTENPFGLHAQFFELEDGRLYSEFTGEDVHQSYPGRMHGGIISAILDEVIGRAVQVAEPEVFGVTIDLQVRFRKPVPLGVPLRVVAEIPKKKGRIYASEAVLLLEDDSVAADATARYLALDPAEIIDGGLSDVDWCDDTRAMPASVVV